MKTPLWIAIIVLMAFLGFLIGYSVAPREVITAGIGAPAGGGYGGGGGGYGAPAGGGYGGGGGGYGAPAGGGYGR